MEEAGEIRAARELAPRVAQRAEEIERERRLPPDLVRALARAGLFGLCVPARYGGRERSVRDLVRAIEEIAIADGAAGWCVMIGATTGLLAASLPEEWAQVIYARNPEVITGGVTAARGRALPARGGHRVSGRWAWCSGVEHCDWVVGGSEVVADAGEGAAATPEVRLVFFERSEIRVLDTWHSSGLRGTGSHDFEVEEVFVPEGRSVLWGGTPRLDAPLYRFPLLGLLALGVSAVSLGIARHALDELVRLAAEKVPTGSRRTLAQRAGVQRQVAEAEADLRSARAFLLEVIDAAWQRAQAGDPLPLQQRADLRLAATNATWRSARAVDLVYAAGGGTSVYAASPLQRCFRDVHVATQHIMVAEPTWELVGQVRLGRSQGEGRL